VLFITANDIGRLWTSDIVMAFPIGKHKPGLGVEVNEFIGGHHSQKLRANKSSTPCTFLCSISA
jgi:hypothetical protein